MTMQRFVVTAVLLLALLAPGIALDEPAAPPVAAKSQTFSSSMLIVENAGQWPEAARFQVWGSPFGTGMTWLAEDAIWVTIVDQGEEETGRRKGGDPFTLSAHHVFTPTSQSGVNLKLTFPGSNPDVRIEPFDSQETAVNYFLGNDLDKWQPAVPVWGGVRYVDLYPGVDLDIGSSDGGWNWRFNGRGNGDFSVIRLQIDGSNELRAVEDGVRITTDSGTFGLRLPESSSSYQPAIVQGAAGARRTRVSGTAEEPAQVPSRHVTNDPGQLVYGTYLGGVLWSEGYAAEADDQGRVIVTGRTHAWDFPTTPGAFNTTFGGGDCGVPPNTYPCPDAFVSQLSADGSALVFSTFLGGSNWDNGSVVAITAQGQVIVAGQTASDDFPVTAGAFDVTCGTDSHCNDDGTDRYSDGFVALLNSNGSMIDYSTYLGGNRSDWIQGGRTDNSGTFWVSGSTKSPDFPTTPGAFDQQFNGATDGFVARLSADGHHLQYGAFVGGSGDDHAYAVDLDITGRAVIAGQTASSDFPTTVGALDRQLSGPTDAFVMRLNSGGNTAEYATYFGGSADETANHLAIDAQGRAYVGGSTNSHDFPTTPGSYNSNFGGGTCGQNTPCRDAFVIRLGSNGNSLQYATYLGGANNDYLRNIVVDTSNRAYVSGATYSVDFPATPDAFDTSFDGHASDCYLSRLSETGSMLEYSTFMGGFVHEYTCAMSSDTSGNVYLAGETQGSYDFPTTPGAFSPDTNGRRDLAFVVKLHIGPYLPNVVARIGQPNAGAFVSGTVNLRGFAIDLSSSSGTGIDRVSMYMDGPYGTGTHIGDPTYGLDRPDIAAQYGARFAPSGWELVWNTAGVSPGVHQLYLYAHRSTDNAWSLMPAHLLVVRGGHVLWLPIMLHSQ